MTGEGPDGGRAHGAACQWQGIERTAVATVLRFRAPHGLPSSAPAFALRRAVASCLPGPCHRATGDGCLPSSRERDVCGLWSGRRQDEEWAGSAVSDLCFYSVAQAFCPDYGYILYFIVALGFGQQENTVGTVTFLFSYERVRGSCFVGGRDSCERRWPGFFLYIKKGR